jgi:hypothetical protein
MMMVCGRSAILRAFTKSGIDVDSVFLKDYNGNNVNFKDLIPDFASSFSVKYFETDIELMMSDCLFNDNPNNIFVIGSGTTSKNVYLDSGDFKSIFNVKEHNNFFVIDGVIYY